jgi:hypothetical protein
MSENDGSETIWYCENGDQFEMFKSEDEGHAWIDKNDPEGVLWKGKRSALRPAGTADQYGVPLATDDADTTTG